MELLPLEEPSLVPPVFLCHVAPVLQDSALVGQDAAPVLQDSAPVLQDMALVLQDTAPELQDTARVPVGSPRQGRASRAAWGRWGWGCCWWTRRQRAVDGEKRKRRVRWGRQCQVELTQVPIPPKVPPLVQWNNTVPHSF